ncbi:MAG TPA: hypothetical protein VI636_10570 [Candidatus Angelobacter sp.]
MITGIDLNPMHDPSGWHFLMAEVGWGLTFVNLAKLAKPEERDRFKVSVRNARKAYDTVIRFRHRIPLEESAREELNAGLGRLESGLRELGGIGRFISNPGTHDRI